MVIRKAYVFRLKTDRKTNQALARFVGCNRFVWNKALEIQKSSLDRTGKVVRYPDMAKLLVAWKKAPETDFLKQAPSQTLQQTLMHLDRALWDSFDKKQSKQFPVFKKKGKSRDSFRYPQGFRFDHNRVFLPKVGWIRFFKSRDIAGTPKNITISKKGDYWHMSVQAEIETAPAPREAATPNRDIVGLDVGAVRLVSASDGNFLLPMDHVRKTRDKLARAEKRSRRDTVSRRDRVRVGKRACLCQAELDRIKRSGAWRNRVLVNYHKLERALVRQQRKLARMEKFSSNWEKQKGRIRKTHGRMADMRRDTLHKITSAISKNHAVVVVEDLRVTNMTRSAKGTKDNPGKGVRAKSGLNRTILVQSWGEMFRMLEYKQEWSGGTFVRVDPMYTSQTCPCCGHRAKANRRTQDRFACLACGFEGQADMVAAMNIRRRGLLTLGFFPETGHDGRACRQQPVEDGRQPSREAGTSGSGDRSTPKAPLRGLWNPIPYGRGGCQVVFP